MHTREGDHTKEKSSCSTSTVLSGRAISRRRPAPSRVAATRMGRTVPVVGARWKGSSRPVTASTRRTLRS